MHVVPHGANRRHFPHATFTKIAVARQIRVQGSAWFAPVSYTHLGIAIEFKRRWPAMFDEYAARCADGRFGLGLSLIHI